MTVVPQRSECNFPVVYLLCYTIYVTAADTGEIDMLFFRAVNYSLKHKKLHTFALLYCTVNYNDCVTVCMLPCHTLPVSYFPLQHVLHSFKRLAGKILSTMIYSMSSKDVKSYSSQFDSLKYRWPKLFI